MNKPTSEILWEPPQECIDNSNIKDFLRWIEDEYSYSFESYEELWDWSVDTDEFWEAIIEYFIVLHDGKHKGVRKGEMPRVKWFEGISLSYAEHVFRNYTDDRPAIIYKTENSNLKELSWQDLVQKVSSLKMFLEQKGVTKGDSVVAYLPNVVEATISFLAVNSIGAIWSSTSPDFGLNSVIERFAQIEPKVLITSEKSNYNGKEFDKTRDIIAIHKQIPSIEHRIVISDDFEFWNTKDSTSWDVVMEIEAEELSFERVEFSHPIWVLYSSGTTGAPKAITHSTGGILLEHFKYLRFHNNLKVGERFFWYSTTGWMMWNYLQSSLLHGCTAVLYDGSPNYPKKDSLWSFIEEAKINHFGIGASFVTTSMKQELIPKNKFDLSTLKSIGSTGSPLPPEGFKWIYNNVKADVWVASISGGTDICSAFVGGNPLKPVVSGEIQSIALGCKLVVLNNSGEELTNEVGEMVIKNSMPSMPIYFWNDENFKKYKESYFTKYPNMWHHGDWTKITKNEGIIIYGRSDATLNRGGVRIGTSEIYRAVDKLPEIEDSIVLSLEKENGEFFMPIFIVVKNNNELTLELISKIKSKIKEEYSPRHVPDEFYKVSDIPYTISGKKMETPLKSIFMGKSINEAIKKGSMKNESVLEEYLKLKDEIDF